MRRIVSFGVIASLLLTAGLVQAGPIKEQALAAARRAVLVQTGDLTHRRSLVRTWSGIGLVGAGLALAFSGRKCGTAGALGPGYDETGPFGFVFVSAQGLRPVRAASGGDCSIEFMLTSRGNVDGQDVSLPEPLRVQIARRSEADILSLFRSPADDVPPDVRDGLVEAIVGSAVATESRSRGRMVAGIGMAGAGILLATVFADAPIAVTRLDRSGVAVGTRFGW